MALKIVAELPEDHKHAGDVLSLAWDKDVLYSGGEDCVIKAWTSDLRSCRVVGSLAGAIVALCSASGQLWAAGMGSELRHWPTIDLPSIQLPSGDGAEFGVLLWKDGTLYAGDDQGIVSCFVNNRLKLMYNMLEEVKGLLISQNQMYTVRDLDVTVTAFFPDSTRYMTLASFEGRAPLRIFEDLMLVVDRTGKIIRIHRNSKAERFKLLGEVTASEMIITSLCVTEDGSIWTGGWDKVIKRWKRDGDTLKQQGEINVGKCIIAMVAAESGRIYAALEGGNVIGVEFV